MSVCVCARARAHTKLEYQQSHLESASDLFRLCIERGCVLIFGVDGLLEHVHVGGEIPDLLLEHFQLFVETRHSVLL